MRILLNHIKGLTSFQDLLSYNGIQYLSFKETAQERGLLESNDSILEGLREAASFQMSLAMRRLFATILVYCQPTNVRNLWDTHFDSMSKDFITIYQFPHETQIVSTLKSVNFFLHSMGKNNIDYDLPFMDLSDPSANTIENRQISYELALSINLEDLHASTILNPEQLITYSIILDLINSGTSGVFFIDGPRGTRKIFLYRALLATTKSRQMILIAMATIGITSFIILGVQTSHSRFKIPINVDNSSLCNISKQSGIAELLRKSKLIIWDEAPMAKQ